LEKVSVSNFKKSEEIPNKILQIGYTNRKYITNEIGNLCMFNYDGACQIAVSVAFEKGKHGLLANHLVAYYDELQKNTEVGYLLLDF